MRAAFTIVLALFFVATVIGQQAKAPVNDHPGTVCVEGMCVPVEVFKAEFAGYKEGDLPPVNQARQAILQTNAQLLQCQAEQLSTDNLSATPAGYRLKDGKYVKE